MHRALLDDRNAFSRTFEHSLIATEMEFGVCVHSIVPVRSEPSHQSEMVTQILFGELYRVMEMESNWIRVQLVYDQYEGWISSLQGKLIDEPEFIRLFGAETAVTADLVQLVSNETIKSVFPVPLGSSLPGYEDQRIQVGKEIFFYEGQISDTAILERALTPLDRMQAKNNIVKDAMFYLHAPYLWGGRSPFGIDCSGLVQMAFKFKKVKLLRDATQQSTQGEVVSLLAEAEPADLAFFDNEEGIITHVGLLIDRFRILHCSGKVRIDPIDHEGIYDETLQKYTHKLRLIKRII